MLLLVMFVPRFVLQYGAEETNRGPYQQLDKDYKWTKVLGFPGSASGISLPVQ